MCSDRNAFRRVSTDMALATPPGRVASLLESASRLTHRSRRLTDRRVRQHLVRSSFGQRPAVGSPCGSPSVVTRDASDRLLPSHCLVRAPASRRLPDGSYAFAHASPRDRLVHARSIRFGGSRVHPFRSQAAAGVVFPSWSARLFTPLTPLSPPPEVVVLLAHHATPRRPPRPPCRARVKRDARPERSGVPSVVQGPSPRDALSSARLRTFPALRLGHRSTGSRRLFTRPPSPGMCGRARPTFTRTAANGLRASLGLSAPLADFCNLITKRGHTLRATDPRARVELFTPLLAGTNRCRLRWPPDASPQRGPASHGPRAPAFAVALHLRGRVEPRAEASEQRRSRALRTMRACPPLRRPGHPGHRLEVSRALDDLALPRSGRDPPRKPPRER
jgi:hypothetical protein